MTAFGQAGHAGDYEPLALDEMARALRPGGGGRLTALAEIDAALAAIPEEGRAAAAGPALVALRAATLLHGRGRARPPPRAAGCCSRPRRATRTRA